MMLTADIVADEYAIKTRRIKEPDMLDIDEQEIESIASMLSFEYFVGKYIYIYDKVSRRWTPFELWDSQRAVAEILINERKIIILKARQLGLTWLVLVYILWQMLFYPTALVLIANARDEEAKDGLRRLKGMYDYLPVWMQKQFPMVENNATSFRLGNGSSAKAIPNNRGDSYPATHVVVDEMSLIENQEIMMEKLGPTIEDGGKFIGIMRANKAKPNCLAHKIYLDARDGVSPSWTDVFLSWNAHPERTEAWYERVKKDHASEPDYMPGQYPKNDAEALSQRQSDKRILGEWLMAVYAGMSPLIDTDKMHSNPEMAAFALANDCPAVPHMQVYQLPEAGVDYSMGVDGAEGLANSDDTVIEIVRADTLEQVCRVSGKIGSGQTADYIADLVEWYGDCYPMVENVNHGYAIIEIIEREYEDVYLLSGPGTKAGWTQSGKGKKTLYNLAAKIIFNRQTIIHNLTTKFQLGNINKDSLEAPEGDHDDDADAFALAIVGADYIADLELSSWGRVKKVG